MADPVAKPEDTPQAISPGPSWHRRLRCRLVEVADEVIRGLPVLLVLLAVTQILELLHADPIGEPMFARWVARVQRPLEPVASGPAFAVVLEITAPAGVLHLEKDFKPQQGRVEILSERISAEMLDRTAGVRPFDRRELASLLTGMARYLKERSPVHRFKVVAIDLDLSPLEDGQPCMQNGCPILDAIDALRHYAPVVIITTDRSPETNENRNAFMREAACTRETAGLWDGTDRDNEPKPLYFASPLVFKRLHEAPFTFLSEIKEKPERAALSEVNAPRWFPSLGNATFFASRSLLSHDAATDVPDEASIRKTLSSLCEMAHGEGTNAATLGRDPTSKPSMNEASPSYRQRMYNWQIQRGSPVERTVLNTKNLVALQQQAMNSVDLDLPKGHALIIGATGPGSTDRYDVPFSPGGADEAMSGAMLHAIASRSLLVPVCEHSLLGILLDIGFGAIFLLASACVAPLPRWLKPRFPLVARSISAMVPLLLMGLLLLASVHVAAYQLDRNRWINPAYLIVGLSLHAYLVGWEQHVGHEHSRWRPLTLGLAELRGAFGRTGPDSRNPGGGVDAVLRVILLWAAPMFLLALLIIRFYED